MVVAISTRNRPMASATIISTRDMPAWDGMRTRHARAPGPRSKPRPQRECAKFIVASIQTLAFLDRPGHRHGHQAIGIGAHGEGAVDAVRGEIGHQLAGPIAPAGQALLPRLRDRKSTRLNSSHPVISYAAFCLKKKARSRHS